MGSYKKKSLISFMLQNYNVISLKIWPLILLLGLANQKQATFEPKFLEKNLKIWSKRNSGHNIALIA